MKGEYLGHLPQNDPMFDYLRREIFSQLGSDCSEGIRVFGTNGSNAVYIYEDRKSCQNVVGKFFYSERNTDWELAHRRLEREYNNIRSFSSYLGNNHYVARILGRNDALNCLLVVEYCTGTPLDRIIIEAVTQDKPWLLREKLTALADFLATVHNRSARQEKVDFNTACDYCSGIIGNLKNLLSEKETARFHQLKENWRNDPVMWEDNQVLVHGDATPSNFFFGDGMYVISFDMERVRIADRCFDVGRIAGELHHFFMRTVGNRYAAEEFVGHFLWEYASRFPDREAAFNAITRRIPFYMGTTLLRIARNSYLEHDYRRALVEAGENCLRKP